RVRLAGIAGLGGAGFPTAIKLASDRDGGIHTLIINGTECEPYITADDTVMQCFAHQIIEGAEILAHMVGAETVLLAVEDNKPEAAEAMRHAAEALESAEVVTFPTKYPSGGEKQLIEILLNAQVPSGGIPADIGVLCQNPSTAIAVRDALIDGKPVTHRVTTVTGMSLKDPGNRRVMLGTPIKELLDTAGFNAESADRVIHGGPMMGFAVTDLDMPVVKITNCVLAPTRSEIPPPQPQQACIRCGMCAEACPASLLPQQLYWYARAKDQDQLERHNLMDCIECGACAYVCPSHIPLVQYYRSAKGSLREAAKEKVRSDNSRTRFEARQERLEREAAAREAKRAARKAAAEARAQAGDDPVQAAIERAKAKKAQQEAEQ
ncbi:MAG: electron transport complex subunit RsxC, partial [Luminiphilus sp.]